MGASLPRFYDSGVADSLAGAGESSGLLPLVLSVDLSPPDSFLAGFGVSEDSVALVWSLTGSGLGLVAFGESFS